MYQKTTMLSMDTSTTCTGVAVYTNGCLEKVLSLTTPKKEPDKERYMINRISTCVKIYKPRIVIAEDLNVMKNIAVAKKLSEIIGAVKGICIHDDIFYDTLEPSKWRKLVAQNVADPVPRVRKDLKEWDIKVAKEYLKLDGLDLLIDIQNDNEADAVLIGEAYKILTKSGD